MANLGLLNNQPSQTMPRFDETAPPDQALATPGAPAPAPSAPASTADPSLPAVDVPPEKLEEYNMFVSTGMKLIHSPETRDRILKHLQSVKPPERALGDATLMVVKRMEQQAKQEGLNLDDLVKLDGSNEIMGQLYEIAETAGLFTLDETGKQRAYGYAVQKYIEEKVSTGELDPNEVKQGMALLQKRQAKIDPNGAALTGDVVSKIQPRSPAPAQQPQPGPPAVAGQQPAPVPQGLIGGA